MNKAIVLTTCLLSSITLFGVTLAHADTPIITAERQQAPISIAAALQTATKIRPARYESIELLPGKNERLFYLIAGTEQGTSVVLILDAHTGQNLTQRFQQPSTTLADAVEVVSTRFNGNIIEASLEFEPYYETVYSVWVENKDEAPLLVLLDSETLKVMTIETLSDEQDANTLTEIDSYSHGRHAEY